MTDRTPPTPEDPYGLLVPFKARYYRRKDKAGSADRVSRLLRMGRNFLECGHLAMRVCGVPRADVERILKTPQRNAVRMMNLSRACRQAIAKRDTPVDWPTGL